MTTLSKPSLIYLYITKHSDPSGRLGQAQLDCSDLVSVCREWSKHKWTVQSTGNTYKTHLGYIWDPITQTTSAGVHNIGGLRWCPHVEKNVEEMVDKIW